MKIYIVIPAYNEAKHIGGVLKVLQSHGYNNIVVVDDGSHDETSAVADRHSSIVVKHLSNMGYGSASITGMETAFRHGADIAVAFDADGQHDVNDIKKIVKPILDEEADVVIGSRMHNPKGMPLSRRIGNSVMSFLTFIFAGLWTTDSQSGFRAVTSDAWKKMKLKSTGFEYASEMIKEIGRNKLKIKEVPIKVIYSDYSMSKGQSIYGGVKTFIGFLKRIILS